MPGERRASRAGAMLALLVVLCCAGHPGEAAETVVIGGQPAIEVNPAAIEQANRRPVPQPPGVGFAPAPAAPEVIRLIPPGYEQDEAPPRRTTRPAKRRKPAPKPRSAPTATAAPAATVAPTATAALPAPAETQAAPAPPPTVPAPAASAPPPPPVPASPPAVPPAAPTTRPEAAAAPRPSPPPPAAPPTPARAAAPEAPRPSAPAATAPSPPPPSPPPPASARVAPPPPPPSAATLPAPAKPVTAASGALRIPFAAASADLSAAAKGELETLARALGGNDTQRLQLKAYAAGTAETASQARRLSLSRALAVRAHLIEAGMRSTRIDVRALGNNLDEPGPADRVDVLTLGP